MTVREEPPSGVYDVFLDACRTGNPPSPDEFLRDHPDAGEETRAGIRALYRELAQADRGESERDERDDHRGETADPADRSDADLPFERLGEFRLLRRLDMGGMGSVFLAEQISLDRVVALKLLRPELAASASAAKRFERESQALARLRHPNIVTVHGAGIDRGVRWLAMEFVEGRRLDDIIAAIAAGREELDVDRVLRWTLDIAEALQFAHERGVVHRDVKPSNIRITADDRALLLDFGVARLTGHDQQTLTVAFAGSPCYAAPEQISPDVGNVDARTDVYALGVTLYQCLTGVVPFTGDTVETTLHRTLVEDPVSPRTIRRAVSPDVETVILRAMEKAPARRYATAAALAEDLRAVLEHRPPKARPPGLLLRARRLARRRPRTAIAVILSSGFAVLLTGILVSLRIADDARQRQEARDMVSEARRRIQAYRDRRQVSVALEKRIVELGSDQHVRYFESEEDAELKSGEHEVAGLRRRREEVFYEVLDLLRSAERLDPDVPDVDTVRAELFLERCEEARVAGDPDGEAFYRQLAARVDADLERRVYGESTVSLTSDPPGAECFLFVYREHASMVAEGDRREVPVPLVPGTLATAPTPVPPGSVLELVLADGGEARAGDLVLGRDDERARIYRDGSVREVVLPAELEVRNTAAPLFLDPGNRLGRTPLASDLPQGEYLFVLRKPGHHLVRYYFAVADRREHAPRVRLPRRDAAPQGFVFVADRNVPPFFIMDREVTAVEYLEFLNDPKTRAAIAASESLILVPRDPDSLQRGGEWTLDAAGHYQLASPWTSRWPVLGVSWRDAREYAAWRSKKDGRRYTLPTARQMQAAYVRRYPWGHVFRPKWTRSCFALRQPAPGPVLSFPIDESPFGVYDLAGSASEWLEGFYDQSRQLRPFSGGSWAHADPETFKASGGNGRVESSTNLTHGFRLVLEAGR